MKWLMCGLLLFISTTVWGQETNYYLNQDTIKASQATFIVEKTLPRLGANIILKNINNKLDTVKIRRSDGKPCVSGEIEPVKTTFQDVVNIVFNNTEYKSWFSAPYRQFVCFMKLDTDGNVLEVKFMFANNSKWASIPPNAYAALEKGLKAKVKYKVPDEMKLQNYVWLMDIGNLK